MKFRRFLTIIGRTALLVASMAPAAHSKSVDATPESDPATALVAGTSCGHWQQSGWLDGLDFSADGSTGSHSFHSQFRFSGEHLDIAVRNEILGLRYRSAADTRSVRVPIAEMNSAGQTEIADFLASLSPKLKNAVNTELLDLALSTGSSTGGVLPFEIAVLNTGRDAAAAAREVAAKRSILDCGSYAVCYWGCVAGGGGWLACGYKCNGGGAGDGRCY